MENFSWKRLLFYNLDWVSFFKINYEKEQNFLIDTLDGYF